MPAQDRRGGPRLRAVGTTSTAGPDGPARSGQDRHDPVHVLHLHLPVQHFDQLCSIAEGRGTLAMALATDWVVAQLRGLDPAYADPGRPRGPEGPADLGLAAVRPLPTAAVPDDPGITAAAGPPATAVTRLAPPDGPRRAGEPRPSGRRGRLRSG